ncbi:MAG TPA: hypothetical protein VGG28_01900 [Kofleriaceae bacterium]
MVEALAEKLQDLLRELLATSIPIVRNQHEPGATAALRVNSGSYGDPYSGSWTSERISLDGCAPLKLVFTYSLHELSGQCDDWTLEISGAPEASRLRFAELFRPRQQTNYWNQNISPSFRFNGVDVGF